MYALGSRSEIRTHSCKKNSLGRVFGEMENHKLDKIPTNYKYEMFQLHVLILKNFHVCKYNQQIYGNR